MGITPFQAALDGAKEVGFTVLSMSLSLIAVFIPILLMGGIVGRLFREFSITLAMAILVSLVVSLTVTPSMCARLLKKDDDAETNPCLRVLQRLRAHYASSLDWALRHSGTMLLATFAAILLTVFLFIVVPKGFFPQQDTGRISGSIQAEQDISFQAMRGILTQYVNAVKADPAVDHVVGFVGGTTVNSGSIYITLKPLNQRHISADGVINRLRSKTAGVIGAMLYLQAAQDLVIGGRQGNAQFQYTLSAGSLRLLNKWAPRVTACLDEIARHCRHE